MTGVNATGDIDVCRAKEIGQKIRDSMTGIPVAQYTFKRSDQVTTLQSKSSVRVDGQPIHVDPYSCSNALLLHPITLTTERRYSVSSCVATHRLSMTIHSCREHHRKPFWRTLSGHVCTRHCRTNWRGSTCVGRWGITPSYKMAAWVPNISKDMRPLL